jgi:hypothetical protein
MIACDARPAVVAHSDDALDFLRRQRAVLILWRAGLSAPGDP